MPLVILIGIAAIVGCTYPYRPAVTPRDQPLFEGISQMLEASAQDDGDVLLVHGMCHHDFNWVKAANEHLAAALAMRLALEPEKQGIALGDGATMHRGELARDRYRLRTHAVLWSPISDARKIEALCYDVSDGNEICTSSNSEVTGRRAYFNAILKDWLMDECLADAMYYVGDEGRPKIQDAIGKAVSLVLSGQPDEPCKDGADAAIARAFRPSERPLVVLTESLGSKILFDTIIEMTKRCAERVDAAADAMTRALKRPVQVFMLANQVPILALAYNPRLDKTASRDSRAGIADVLARMRPPARLRPLADGIEHQVVAFSDPSDVLSYTLRFAPGRTGRVEFDDVLVTNAPVWFGKLEWPANAHMDYWITDDVMRGVACGSVGLRGPCEPLGAPRNR